MVAMSAANSLNRVQLIRDKVILGVSDSLYCSRTSSVLLAGILFCTSDHY